MRNAKRTLAKNAPAIRALARADKDVQKALLSNASREFMCSLVTVINQVLKGKVSLTRAQLDKLRPYERQLKKFVSSKTPLKERRLLAQGGRGQKGGFLFALGKVLPLALKVLGSLGNSS